MAIQIEQLMPRCLRCGKLVHARDEERIEDELGLFCSAICRAEYAELQPPTPAEDLVSTPSARSGQ